MKTKIIISIIGLSLPILVCCNEGLQNQSSSPLEFLLMGQAAKDLTANPNAIGLMSAQQLCDRKFDTVVNLSPNGNYLSAFQSTQFIPTIDNKKALEIMKADQSFWGFGLENTTPLGWSMFGDTFHLTADDNRLLELNPRSMEVRETTNQLNLGPIIEKQEYLGFDGGVIAFRPATTSHNVNLVDLDSPTRKLTLETPTEVTKLVKNTCGAKMEVSAPCSAIFEARSPSAGDSLTRPIIEALEYRVSNDFKTSELVGRYRSPALADGAYIGKMPNGDHLWLGYGNTFRALFVVSADGHVSEFVSPIGDVFEAAIEDNGNITVRGFDLRAARLVGSGSGKKWTSPVDGSVALDGSHLPFLLSSLASNWSQSRLFSADDDMGQQRTFIITKTGRRDVAVGCAENSFSGKLKTAGAVKYVEFLPSLSAPRGIVFYLHGGPYSQQSLNASPMLAAWLKRGYMVWAIEPPGSVGFQFDHFLPTESYIRNYFETSGRLLVEKYEEIKPLNVGEFKVVYLGHSFGAFGLMQITSLLPKFSESRVVLINTPCRDFLTASTDRDLLANSNRYRHAIQVGRAYQSTGTTLSRGRHQCQTNSGIPTSIFASVDDQLISPSNSRQIARLSGLKVVTIDKQRHSLAPSGADFVVQSIDPLAPRTGASEHE
jgi:pimeloyl-ACP methyl ester carboxylesterase